MATKIRLSPFVGVIIPIGKSEPEMPGGRVSNERLLGILDPKRFEGEAALNAIQLNRSEAAAADELAPAILDPPP